MDPTAKKLSQFMRRELGRTREEGSRLESFQLRSAGMGKKGSEVDTFPIPTDLTIDNVGLYVDEVLARAQEDANGSGSVRQRYVLVALASGERDGPRHQFALRGEGEDDEGDGVEEPTEKGLIGQMMRHNEALMRMAMMGASATTTQLARQLEAERDKNEKLHNDRGKFLLELEVARTHNHERDVQMLQVGGEEERKAEFMKSLQGLFPVIVNKLAGRPALPEGPQSDLLKSFVTGMDDAQLKNLLATIGPLLRQDQQIQLMTLIQAARGEGGNNGVPS